MSGRTLSILLVAFGAALALVFWLDPGRERGPDDAPAPGPLSDHDDAAVERVELASATGPAFAIARDDTGTFRLDDGRGLEADASRVAGLLAALRDTRVERALEPAAAPDPAAAGLSPPERTVKLTEARRVRVVEIGRASPVAYRRYARVDGGPVLLVDGAIGAAVDRSREDFLERRLLPVEAMRVRRIEIAGPRGRLVLERPASEWRIVEPFDDRADLGAAENLARSMTAILVDGLGEGAPPFEGGTTVRVEAEPGGPTREARVAAEGGAGGRPVERLPGPVRGRILEAAARDLDRDAESMRDTRVAAFSSPDVRAIAWTSGAERLRARRGGGGGPWTREDPDGARLPVDAAAVETLLDSARWLRAVGFASGPAPTAAAIGRLELSGEAGTIDALDFFDDGVAGTVLVRAAARPGAGCRVTRAGFDELAAKAGALAR